MQPEEKERPTALGTERRVYALKAQNRPASAKQKQVLGMLARDAWRRLEEVDGIEPGDRIDEWRRREAEEAAGCRISDSRSGDYLLLGSHFLQIAGRTGEAFAWIQRWQREAGGIMAAALADALRRFGYPAEYAEAIARDRWGKGVSSLGPEELRQLCFTIDHNGRAARRRTQSQNQPQTQNPNR